jgi:putative protease
MIVKKKAKKAVPTGRQAKVKAKPKVKKEKLLGKIAHYFDKIQVAAINVVSPIKVGDIVHIKGHTTNFEQPITSMQIEHEMVTKAKKGDDIGIKVKEYVRDNDGVYLKK